MSENKRCVCGWDHFEVEIRDAEDVTVLRCIRCKRTQKIRSKKAAPAPSRPSARAVDAICRDFDADKAALLYPSGSSNPLKFPRP